MSSTYPNPNKWDNWVSFAWAIAIFSVLSACIIILKFGSIEATEVTSYGNRISGQQVNFTIWAICIGQSIAACMTAALFSMINSIYKNTCNTQAITNQHLPAASSANLPRHNNVNKLNHPQIVSLNDKSAFFDRVYSGWFIAAVNGQNVRTSSEVSRYLKKGDNTFTFIKPDGEEVELDASLRNSDKLNMALNK